MRTLVLVLGLVLLTGVGFFVFRRHPAPPAHFVTLTWHAAVETKGSKVVSYNIYRSLMPGGPYARRATDVRGLSFHDDLVRSGVTYYYIVRSVDESGNESRASEEVRATVPSH